MHTKGPWTVDETKSLGAICVWAHSAHDGKDYKSQICSMVPTLQDPPREQRDANARLIAAAPDLLAALEMFLLCPPRDRHDMHLEEVVMMAITKAKGTS